MQFVRILPGPIEKIWDYLWDGEKRGEWFATGAMPTKVGETFRDALQAYRTVAATRRRRRNR